MAQHVAEVSWSRGEAAFTDGRYSRCHTIRFDGGVELAASASPHIVPAPMSDAAAVDPEEAFVASLASCHLLWFLSLACDRGWRVERYVDEAVGTLAKNEHGKLAMTVVTLHPLVTFGGDVQPSPAEIVRLHQQAHGECFLANSVKTDVRCEPRIA